MINQKPVTRTETYLRSSGSKCPSCQSDNIEAGRSTEMDDAKLFVPVSCNDCEATWDEEYDLTGIANTEGFDPDETVELKH